MRKAVVTGLGIVSSIGSGKEVFWKNLLAGKSGISTVSSFPTTDFKAKNGGEIHNFKFKNHKDNTSDNYGRASQLAIVAANLAIKDSF